MADNDGLVLNNISARALKTYFMAKIGEMVDELVTKKYPQKKKLQYKRPDTRIPVDLIKKEFVDRFNLSNYENGVSVSLINSLVENNYFGTDGKLDLEETEELVITEIEKRILENLDKSSPLYIDVGDVKTLSSRLKTSANCFNYKDKCYRVKSDKIEDLINQLLEDGVIYLDEKSSIKDSVYSVPEDFLDILKIRLFRCPQAKDGYISRIRLFDYFNRVTKQDTCSIYVILKDKKIAEALGIETVNVGNFIYTKHSVLVNSISGNMDRYSKKFQDCFYESIAEFVKDNEKINVSKVVECLTVPHINISDKEE